MLLGWKKHLIKSFGAVPCKWSTPPQNLGSQPYQYVKMFGLDDTRDSYLELYVAVSQLQDRPFLFVSTLQPLYNTVRYNTVLDIKRFKNGPQKYIDYIVQWP